MNTGCHQCQELEQKIIDAAENVADHVVIGTAEGGYVHKLVQAVNDLHQHLKKA